ncbi:uncharacterized protein LOC121726329 isoform X2 [Aricia agestis]|nr:uncharacterized protein LOC121726329 isoform X2 [Aricia agestis]
MPKAFLTIEEFKQELTNRIVRQRLTTTLKTTLSKILKVKINRNKRTQLPRYTKKETSSPIKSTISGTPVEVNKYSNKTKLKNNRFYPTNKHLKALTNSNTLTNINMKTKNTLRRKTTIQSMTPKNITINRHTPATKFRYFKNAIMRKLTTSTRTPVLKSIYTNKTTVKLITTNLPKEKSTFKDSDTTTRVTLRNNSTTKEKLLTITSVGATTEDASTIVHITSKNDLTTETVATSKEISRKDLILNNTTTEETNTLHLTSKREVSTTDKFTSATDISLKGPKSEDTTIEELKRASTTHTNEIFKRETTFEDSNIEKVTTTHNNITITNEFNDNLGNKLLATPQGISRNDSNLDNIFEILSVPKEMFGKESAFENTTINKWTTPESSTKNLKSLLRFADAMMKSYKPAKRTPRRKKKVRLVETTIKYTTKYKRLERPLVFMGGYEQSMNKYAKDVNVIEFK